MAEPETEPRGFDLIFMWLIVTTIIFGFTLGLYLYWSD